MEKDPEDYLWQSGYRTGNIDIKRGLLDRKAIAYDLDPSQYKNKKLLIYAILDIYERNFINDHEYKLRYESIFGVKLDL